MNITQEKITGFAGATIFCGLLILVFYFTFLSTIIKAEEQGVLVNFGQVDWASGMFEPYPEGRNMTSPIENLKNTTTEINPIKPEMDQPVITQETEQTATVDDAVKKKKELERQEQERQERLKKEEEQRRIAINQQMQNAFAAGDTPKSSEGTANSGSGNQGSIDGNAPVGSYTGIGGYGSFDLAGRSITGGLPRPAYSAQEEGKIVINITVDPSGNILSAEIGRGTNIANGSMRTSALDAARRAKFNAINNKDNQSGTITYIYKLR